MHCVSLHRERVNPQKLATGWHSADSGLDPFELWEMINGKFSWSPCVWRNGLRRANHFDQCSWMVLDFDDGRYTLQDAARDWCEHTHLIATTKSHGIPKNGAAACDRFRLCVPFERTITDARELKHNLTLAIDKYGSDPSCKDAGRFFFPCVDLISCQYGDYKQAVEEAPEEEPTDYRPRIDWSLTQPTRIFLRTGQAPRGAHKAAMAAAFDILECGYSESAALVALQQVKAHREWTPGELEGIIKWAKAALHKKRVALGYES